MSTSVHNNLSLLTQLHQLIKHCTNSQEERTLANFLADNADGLTNIFFWSDTFYLAPTVNTVYILLGYFSVGTLNIRQFYLDGACGHHADFRKIGAALIQAGADIFYPSIIDGQSLFDHSINSDDFLLFLDCLKSPLVASGDPAWYRRALNGCFQRVTENLPPDEVHLRIRCKFLVELVRLVPNGRQPFLALLLEFIQHEFHSMYTEVMMMQSLKHIINPQSVSESRSFRFAVALLKSASGVSNFVDFSNPNLTDELAAKLVFHFNPAQLEQTFRTPSYTVDFSNHPKLTIFPLGLGQIKPDPNFSAHMKFKFSGCNLKGTDALLAKHGDPSTIIQYCKNITQGKSIEIRETKCIFLGAAAAGKTCLAHRLSGQPFQPSSLSTDGIEIGSFQIRDINFHTFDFGGQEVYRYTHQLFLCGTCIILLMFKLTDPILHSIASLQLDRIGHFPHPELFRALTRHACRSDLFRG